MIIGDRTCTQTEHQAQEAQVYECANVQTVLSTKTYKQGQDLDRADPERSPAVNANDRSPITSRYQ